MMMMPVLRGRDATGQRRTAVVAMVKSMLCRHFHPTTTTKKAALLTRRVPQPHRSPPGGPMIGSSQHLTRVSSIPRGWPTSLHVSSGSPLWMRSRGTTGNGVVRWHGGGPGDDAPTVTISFVQPDNSVVSVPARIGESLLQTAHRNNIDLEGACEGVCACSTCHLIFPTELYDTLPDPSEDEEDMLDMAFGLTETSRLGCQITVTAEMDGAVLELPKATRNFYVDGHVPKPH